MTHWTKDNGSVVILGGTQSGKTTAARELHAKADRISVWIMPRGNEAVPGVKGAGNAVGSVRALNQAIQDGKRHIVWQTANVGSALEGFRAYWWEVAQRTKRKARIQLVVDEIHNWAPEGATKAQMGSRDAVRKIAKEGQKRGLKLVAITQDPVSLDKQALRQMSYLLMFEISPTQRDAFTRWGIDWHAVTEVPEFCAVLFENRISGKRGDARIIDRQVCPSSKFAV